MRTVCEDYEYIGFSYRICEKEPGWLVARPVDGQHPAANKQKHCMAAASLYEQETTT